MARRITRQAGWVDLAWLGLFRFSGVQYGMAGGVGEILWIGEEIRAEADEETQSGRAPLRSCTLDWR